MNYGLSKVHKNKKTTFTHGRGQFQRWRPLPFSSPLDFFCFAIIVCRHAVYLENKMAGNN